MTFSGTQILAWGISKAYPSGMIPGGPDVTGRTLRLRREMHGASGRAPHNNWRALFSSRSPFCERAPAQATTSARRGWETSGTGARERDGATAGVDRECRGLSSYANPRARREKGVAGLNSPVRRTVLRPRQRHRMASCGRVRNYCVCRLAHGRNRVTLTLLLHLWARCIYLLEILSLSGARGYSVPVELKCSILPIAALSDSPLPGSWVLHGTRAWFQPANDLLW